MFVRNIKNLGIMKTNLGTFNPISMYIDSIYILIYISIDIYINIYIASIYIAS